MKKAKTLFFSLALCLAAMIAPARTSLEFNETGRLAMLVRVWGFLKYYHPQQRLTMTDWDTCLMTAIPKAKLARDAAEFSDLVIGLINEAGPINPIDFPNLAQNNKKSGAFFSWLGDESFFTPTARYMLNVIWANLTKPNAFTHYRSYTGEIDPGNEVNWDVGPYPAEEFRLLALARFWNLVQYFFPYRILMDRPWDDALSDMIPKFTQARDAFEYALAVLELTARLNDSHTYVNFYSRVIEEEYWGTFYPPFRTKTVEGQVVITMVLDPGIDFPAVGDIILGVDGENVADFRSRNEKYFGASNRSFMEYALDETIGRGKSEWMTLAVEREGLYREVEVQRIDYVHYMRSVQAQLNALPVWRLLDNDIAYVNVRRLSPALLDPVLDQLQSCRAIIFDVRNYPYAIIMELMERLLPSRVPFATFYMPDPSRPGFLVREADSYCGPYPASANYYRGKVVMLFDEETLSMAEFLCMALQTVPGATAIGSQTAGADGNVTRNIPLPGGITACFTGLSVFYPDGRQTQRIGIVPDIEARPTIKGIREGVDDVLQRAIAFIGEE
jgi:carboxyl-terminal processing protease